MHTHDQNEEEKRAASELTDKEMEMISGGDDIDDSADKPCCPRCGSFEIHKNGGGGNWVQCYDCGFRSGS